MSGIRTFVFAGGGTGGHLFPGIAVAERVVAMERAREGGGEARCVFLCSDRAIDAKILGEATLGGGPVEFAPTRAAPFVVRPKGLAKFLGGWGPTVRQARGVIRAAREKGSVQVVALGGFVAAPVVQAARVERVPITMLNLDAVPGLANRWIARRADAIFTSAAVEGHGAGQGGRAWMEIPPIVREAAVGPAGPEGRAACRRGLGLEPGLRTLVVTGASQGARSINRLMEAFVERERGVLEGWQVFHQTGRDEVERTREVYARAGVPARVESFIASMGMVWGAADLAVSRAGAGSVGEAWANGTPTIFLPYPYHKDQHQKANALPLERCGGAVVVEDLIEPEPNMDRAGKVLADLLRDEGPREAMRHALAALGPADGAERVAKALVGACGGVKVADGA